MNHILLIPFSDTKPPTHTHTQKPPSPLNTATCFNIKYRNITSPMLLSCKETPPHLSTKITQLESTLGPPEDRKHILYLLHISSIKLKMSGTSC